MYSPRQTDACRRKVSRLDGRTLDPNMSYYNIMSYCVNNMSR